MKVQYLRAIQHKRDYFFDKQCSASYTLLAMICNTLLFSWWSIIANYSLPRRLRPKGDAWHVFCHRRSQDPGIPKLVDVLFVYMYLYLCSLHFVLLSFLYFPSCILTHILLEMVPRSRDSQIGCCLLPEAAPQKQQLVGTNISRVRGVFPTIKHKFCILYFVFVFCFHDLGIPKLVVVIPKAAPHKQQLVVTNISWATGVFQTKYRSVLNKFKKSRNSYYSVLFGELVPKPVIIS